MIKNKINTLVVDDEPLARQGIINLLKRDNKFAFIGECGNGKDTVKMINNIKPDLVFLDIQMPELNGLEVLNQIKINPLPVFVFVTAYDKYSLDAFELNAVDYLLKPFSDKRFMKTLERVKDIYENNLLQEMGKKLIAFVNDEKLSFDLTVDTGLDTALSDQKYLEKLTVKHKNRLWIIPVDDIVWIEADDYYANVHTNSDTFVMRQSLKSFEKSLDPNKFIRIHRSSIVNISMIGSITPMKYGDQEVILKNNISLKLSRSRKKLLKIFLPSI